MNLIELAETGLIPDSVTRMGIRRLLGRRLALKHTPRLTFEFDKNFQETLEIYRIIDDAMQEIRDKDLVRSADDQADPAEPTDS